MFEVKHMELGVSDNPKYRFADIYVKNRTEAQAVKTDQLVQGSKLFIIETAELFVLNEDGGVWCSAVDGTVMEEVSHVAGL